MTNESIAKEFTTTWWLEISPAEKILVKKLMDAAREDEAIAFNRWRDGEGWECILHDDEDVKHWQCYGDGEILTDKQLYQLYKNR